MMQKDWADDVVTELEQHSLIHGELSYDVIKSVIQKHCPFKPDVAYEPVVERSAYALQLLRNVGVDTTCPACNEQAFTGTATLSHTCEPKVLLQCVECRNTESPAGAMARYFNHGRCLHCGGYFKVVRA